MNPNLEALSCYDDRFVQPDSFTDWAQSRWVHFQAEGPLAFQPARKGYAVGDWRGLELGHYAALYAPEVAIDLADFTILERYTSSLQQTLIRDPEPETDWFHPEKETEGVLGLLRYWQNVPRVWKGEELAQKLIAWKLPQACKWVTELDFIEGLVNEHADEANLVAATRQGYLTVFILNG